jgi:hypothetical protein
MRWGKLSMMPIKALTDVVRRAETWPAEAQEELAAIAREMDDALKGGNYDASPEELAGIDRSLAAARDGRFASPERMRAIFAKHRLA